MLSWSWRSIKLLLLHLVGVPYYFTYNDDARSHTNQVYLITMKDVGANVGLTWSMRKSCSFYCKYICGFIQNLYLCECLLPLTNLNVHGTRELYKLILKIINSKKMCSTHYSRASSDAVGLGTALQAGRSRVRFPMVSLEFFIDVILPVALWPWGWLSLWQKWVPGIFTGGVKATTNLCRVCYLSHNKFM
jgi:hypothetical protein